MIRCLADMVVDWIETYSCDDLRSAINCLRRLTSDFDGVQPVNTAIRRF